tara:strand:- start:11056 stop:11733 length:678 start_codon:yes stop_codon:yes gene_type:complete
MVDYSEYMFDDISISTTNFNSNCLINDMFDKECIVYEIIKMEDINQWKTIVLNTEDSKCKKENSIKVKLTKSKIKEQFKYSQIIAANNLDVGLSTLKTFCSKNNIKWPHPKIKNKRNIEVHELEALFIYEEAIAAKKLGVSVSTLKNECRRNGIKRWPHRKFQSMFKKLCKLRGLPLEKFKNWHYEELSERYFNCYNFNDEENIQIEPSSSNKSDIDLYCYETLK